MANLPVQLELDRLLNLIRGFGWELKEQKIEPELLLVTVTKKITPVPTSEPQ